MHERIRIRASQVGSHRAVGEEEGGSGGGGVTMLHHLGIKIHMKDTAEDGESGAPDSASSVVPVMPSVSHSDCVPGLRLNIVDSPKLTQPQRSVLPSPQTQQEQHQHHQQQQEQQQTTAGMGAGRGTEPHSLLTPSPR